MRSASRFRPFIAAHSEPSFRACESAGAPSFRRCLVLLAALLIAPFAARTGRADCWPCMFPVGATMSSTLGPVYTWDTPSGTVALGSYKVTVTGSSCPPIPPLNVSGPNTTFTVNVSGTLTVGSGPSQYFQAPGQLSISSWFHRFAFLGDPENIYIGDMNLTFSGGTLPANMQFAACGYPTVPSADQWFLTEAGCVNSGSIALHFGGYRMSPDGGTTGYLPPTGDSEHPYGCRLSFIYYSGAAGGGQGTPVPPIAIYDGGSAPVFQFASVPTAPSECLQCPASSAQWVAPQVDSGFVFVTTDTSLFTGIADFPTGFAQPFTVRVGGATLGTFAPGDSVRFASYAGQLGDSLVGGAGVHSFVVSHVTPGATVQSHQVFPLRIAVDDTVAHFNATLYSPPTTSVDSAPRLTGSLILAPASPNPFVATSRIRYSLARAAESARLRITDVSGRRVRSLELSSQPAGPHEVVWDGRDDSGRPVIAGVYFYQLRIEGESANGRLTRVR